ncbi:hypothetical protein FACS189493_6240 [Spirochaetia bacterium]|nr:hypothetical protein FACS189493_6240 [Spirochaetia bacterium]
MLIIGGVTMIAVTVILIFSTSRIAITSDSAGVVMLDGKETKYTIQTPGTITLYNWPKGSFSVSLKTDNGAVIQAVNSAWVRKGKTAKVYIFNDLLKATEKYTDMIKSKPGNAELFIIRGLIYNARSDAILHDPEYRGGVMSTLFDLYGWNADGDFAEALRLAPNNAAAKENLEDTRKARGY